MMRKYRGRHTTGHRTRIRRTPATASSPTATNYKTSPENPQTPPVPQDERTSDDHEFPAEEQPLSPVDSPTAESPGYVTESDPEEDPEGYEDDETEDGPDEEDDEEEEHLAPLDSTRPTSISLPPEAEVERLLTMTTPSPSPPISLSPPSAGERLARFTAALPSPSLPPLPQSLYIPPPVDLMDDLPESELPPRKRLCLSTLSSRYEIGESSTARPTKGQGVDYGFISTIDAEARRQGISEVGYGIRDTWVDLVEAVPEVAPMTVGEVNTRVTELAELHEHDTHHLYALLEDAQDRDSMDYGGGGLCFLRGLGSLDRIELGDPSGALNPS
ncbi:hypothetical protein Tco_0170018 [Tanacetum coccineum]